MKQQIKDFKLLDTDDNKLLPRSDSIIDWIQEGIVEADKVAVMSRKWRRKFKERYIGIVYGADETAVVFSDRDII